MAQYAAPSNYRKNALDQLTGNIGNMAMQGKDATAKYIDPNRSAPDPSTATPYRQLGGVIMDDNGNNINSYTSAPASGDTASGAQSGTPAAEAATFQLAGRATTRPGDSSFDVNGAYNDILNATKGAADASFANTEQQLYGQQAGIDQGYNAANAQAYGNARLSALGNNEAMASQGLTGNAYAAPQSGYSESSRIAQNAALGNNINANELARRNALDALMGQANTARTSRDASLLGSEANIYGQKANAMQNQAQFDANMALQNKEFLLNEAGVTGTYKNNPTMAKVEADRAQALAEAGLTGIYNGQTTMAGKQFNSQEEQRAYDNAMNQFATLGKITTQKQADILGLKIGTTTLQAQEYFNSLRKKKPTVSDSSIVDSSGGNNPSTAATGTTTPHAVVDSETGQVIYPLSVYNKLTPFNNGTSSGFQGGLSGL